MKHLSFTEWLSILAAIAAIYLIVHFHFNLHNTTIFVASVTIILFWIFRIMFVATDNMDKDFRREVKKRKQWNKEWSEDNKE